MARFNKAKNFLGKSYVVSNEIETLIKSMNFQDDILKFGANKIGEDNVNLGLGLDFSKWVSKGTVEAITGNALVDGKILVADGESAVKDSGYTLGAAEIKEYILEGENADYEQAATTLATESAVMHAIVASSVDYGDGLKLSTENGKSLSVDIKLQKVAATDGFASSYQLMVKNSSYVEGGEEDEYIAVGDTINIAKDQFLKGAQIATGSLDNGAFTANAEGEKFIHFTFEINKKDSDGKVTLDENHIYLNIHELVDAYTAGNGITVSDDNVISAVVDGSDKVFASRGVESSILSVGTNGIKASGIQAAIDLAVEDLKVKSQAAIDDLADDMDVLAAAANSQIDAVADDLAGKVNAAIGSVDTNVTSAVADVNEALTETVGSVNGKVGDAVTALDGKVDGAVDAVNTAVTSTVSNINTALTGTVASINNKVSTIVDALVTDIDKSVEFLEDQVKGTINDVNEALTETVDSVNTQVDTAVTALDGKVDTAIGDVNTAISTAFTNVFQMVEEASVKMEQVVTTDDEGKEVVLPVVKEITGRVLAVYDAEGFQVYPEVKYLSGITTITVDFGVRKEEQEGVEVIKPYSETWTVLKTAAVVYTAPAAVAAVKYTDAEAGEATYVQATTTRPNLTYGDNVVATTAAAVAAQKSAAVQYTDAEAGEAAYSKVAASIQAADAAVAVEAGAKIADLDYKVAAQA